MVKRSCIALLIAVLASAAFSQQPKSLKDTPIYPGAARDEAAMAEEREAYGDERNPNEISRERVIYSSTASVEEVFSWYRQKLGAKPENPNLSPPPLAAGAAIKPAYFTTPYQAEDFRDGEDPVNGKKTYDGAWMKDQLKARRKPVEGAYLSGCGFEWTHVDQQGRSYDFHISVEDHTFDAYMGLAGDGVGFAKKEYRQSSSIGVELVVYKAEEEIEEEEDAAGDELVEARKAQLKAAPPTAKELGVPLYPGAAFNLDASAGMSMDEDSRAYVYLSGDAPAKIVAFYEKATGKKAEPLDAGAYRVVLKGKGAFPEHFLSIEPNTMFGGAAKTVLCVFKTAP